MSERTLRRRLATKARVAALVAKHGSRCSPVAGVDHMSWANRSVASLWRITAFTRAFRGWTGMRPARGGGQPKSCVPRAAASMFPPSALAANIPRRQIHCADTSLPSASD